jgi:non-specific serine/threonine protein kinase
VLATSREVFDMEGEAIYYAPSLSMPEEYVISLPKISDHESIQLFTERAAVVLSSFRLTTENLQTVVDICRRVDGIPLAIEMAAARVDILQVDEILRQLNHCFDLLVGKSRTALPRHQTMRASMDWSWGLLTESEQVLMRRLSVFAGGWTLEAAQIICEGDALNLTSALVRKSLIMVNRVSGRETRYRFHEIIRQYAREKLIEANEEANIRTQHLKYYLILSEQAEPALRGPAQVQWLAHLNDERDNLRTALEWAAIKDVEAGLYLSGRLQYFWYNFDSLEGTVWLSEFIQKPESNAYPLAKARALCTQGWLLHWNQQLADARALAEECLDLYKDCGDKQGEVEGLLLLASSTNFLGNSRQGGELARQALALAQSLGDTWRQAKAFVTLGWTEGRDLKRRISYWKKAIILFRKVGDLRFLAGKLSAVGSCLALNGDIESAQEYLDESALLVQQFSPKNIASHQVSEGYIEIAMMRGDYEQARRLLQNLEEATKESGDRMSYLHARIGLGQLDLRDGNITKAHRIFTENVQIFQKDQIKDGVVFTLERMASIYIVIRKPELAARLIGWADATRREIDVIRSYLEQVDVDKMIADCLAKMGEIAFSDAYDEGAKMSLDEAVALALGPMEEINESKRTPATDIDGRINPCHLS